MILIDMKQTKVLDANKEWNEYEEKEKMQHKRNLKAN